MRKMIALLLACLPFLVCAQIAINVVAPPSGLVNKDQLWNLVLTNNTNSTLEVSLLLNLRDATTGQSALSAGTHYFLLEKGVKVITPMVVQPVQYTYDVSDFAGNFLPLGSYIACYTVARRGGEHVASVTTECIRINITPLSPPLLNSPSDKSVLKEFTPHLTWTPPSPLNMFKNLTYDISVAEVMPGQSTVDAIQFNTPLYVAYQLKAPYTIYPSTYSKLEQGKTYAWQVTARNGQQYGAASEVWSFTIAGDSVKINQENRTYIELKKEAPGFYYVEQGELNVRFYSFEKTHEATVNFLDKDKKLLQQTKQKIQYGENYIRFRLNRRFAKGETYSVEITDQQNQVYTAKFSIK